MRAQYQRWAWQAVLGLLLIAPWLIPPLGAPTPSLWQQLSSLACMALLLGTSDWWIQKARRVEVVQVTAGAWLAAALISSAMGLVQYWGMAHGYALLGPADGGEAYGTLRQRNQYATLINIGLLSLIWWLGHLQRDRPNAAVPWMWHVAGIQLAIGNAASLSRTGMLQLLLIVAMTLFWSARNAQARRVLITVTLAYMVAVLMLPLLGGAGNASLIGRFQSASNVCTSRLTLWINVLHLLAQRPWLGWGWGELDYAHFTTVYEGPRFCEILDNAHNLPLQLAVEFGVPVALLLCGVLGWQGLRAQPWCEKDTSRQLAWGVIALILLHSMLEYPLWYGPFQMALGMSLVLLMVWGKESAARERKVREQWKKKVGLVLSGVSVLGAVAYTAWDYHRISQIYLPPEQRALAYREDTLEKIRGSWLFKDQVRFAEYTITPLTQNNAEQLYVMGLRVLHFSPEPKVVEKLIECTVMLGRDEEARFYLARYKAAYPQEHARWAALRQPVQRQD